MKYSKRWDFQFSGRYPVPVKQLYTLETLFAKLHQKLYEWIGQQFFYRKIQNYDLIKYAIFYSKWLDPSEEEEEDDMSEEDELVELPGGLDQLEAIAEEYAKREEGWRFFLLLFATCLQCSHRFRIRSHSQCCGTGTVRTVTFWLVEPEP